MSRQNVKPKNSGVRLPHALQTELGFNNAKRSREDRRLVDVRTRKEQRKALRTEKKAVQRGRRPHSVPKYDEIEEGLDGEDEEEDSTPTSPQPAKASPPKAGLKGRSDPNLKSILKRPKEPSHSPSPTSSRASSPALVLDASSKAFKDRAAQDDAEITALEKKLGLKKKRLPKSFEDDGLADLLDGLEEDLMGQKRKRDEAEWLQRKRRRADDAADSLHQGGTEDWSTDDDDLGAWGDDDEEGEGEEEIKDDFESGEDGEAEMETSEEDDFTGFLDLEEETKERNQVKVRENPYVAPVAAGTPTAKYVPPSMRKGPGSDEQSVQRLRRQIQGHLNKLSEANLVSILNEIEKVYQSNPRYEVTAVLIDLLLGLFCNRSALSNTFVILHAAFVAAVYKIVGVDFGAELLSNLVDRFDHFHHGAVDTGGKESLNLISLLSNLFTFHVLGSTIIFDYIRLLLEKLSESNTELLLRLVRDCGPQLRQDDPSSLKSIVQLTQKEAARMASTGQQMTVRTKFMIETVTELKNNKMKGATNAAGIASEHITRMRKVLGSLNNRNIKASEPLRISRDDIQNSDKKGKWWLVGASWKGKERVKTVDQSRDDDTGGEHGPDCDPGAEDDVDLLALARQYGMNTDVRRSIFVALLSAVDFEDAHMRLLKLRLKRSQELEIPKVLLRCAAGEVPYNPYYTLVAKRLCSEKRMRKAFQFALWGFFRRLGENTGMDEGDEEEEQEQNSVEMTEIANMARLYAQLIVDGAVTIGVLKVVDLVYVKERTAMFVELLLVTILTQARSGKEEEDVLRVFERAAETPQIVKRLQFFLKKHVRNSDLVTRKDKDAIKWGCKVALGALRTME